MNVTSHETLRPLLAVSVTVAEIRLPSLVGSITIAPPPSRTRGLVSTVGVASDRQRSSSTSPRARHGPAGCIAAGIGSPAFRESLIRQEAHPAPPIEGCPAVRVRHCQTYTTKEERTQRSIRGQRILARCLQPTVDAKGPQLREDWLRASQVPPLKLHTACSDSESVMETSEAMTAEQRNTSTPHRHQPLIGASVLGDDRNTPAKKLRSRWPHATTDEGPEHAHRIRHTQPVTGGVFWV